ncbi:MAG: efflux RND transporter permease subunit [Clostridiales Family XIII bacterium]|jgi:HAE1 family hydrophobic/amphiphilic exporter-1|nr:efflux RND transporter permease subunit [Clostridiales Family XIII bacterium]
MSFSKIAVLRPVSAVMLMLIILVLGAVSFSRLALDLYPNIDMPMAAVMTQYPNAASEEVETMITRPIEMEVATVQKLKRLTSVTSEGSSMVTVEFEGGTDMNFAGLRLREAVDRAGAFLPEGTGKPLVATVNMNMMPMAELYVSGALPMPELQRVVDEAVRPAISRTAGVASANSFGGADKEIYIELDQERLAGYKLTLSQISQALAAENVNLPSGSVTRGGRKMIVRTMGEFGSVEELGALPIALPTREVVYLRDLGTIQERDKEATSIGRFDGENAIGVSVVKQASANTASVSKELRKTLDRLRAEHPDIDLSLTYDQADFINASLKNVAETALLGCLLAIIVCFLFLRNFASTFVIAVSIPTSIIATFALMYFNRLTLNVLSLSGLAVGIGMLVDDSIVVMENIYRLRNGGSPAIGASMEGAREVTMPVIAATLTKIAVFLPIVFAQGLVASIFKDFSFTISFSLLCSLLVALTVVPMLCSRLLNIKNIPDHFCIGKKRVDTPLLPLFDKLTDGLARLYAAFLRRALRRRKSVIAASLALFVLSAVLVGMVGGELMPAIDEGRMEISVTAPQGTSIAAADDYARQVEDYVKANIPEMTSYSSKAGVGAVGSTGSAGTAIVSVSLTDRKSRTRTTEEVVARAVEDLEASIVGAQVSAREVTSMGLGGSGGGNDIAVTVKGDDLGTLRKVSNDFAEIMKCVPGAANVKNSIGEGSPEARARLDRAKAAVYGVTASQLAQTLKSSLSGTPVAKLRRGGVETDVALGVKGSAVRPTEDLARTPLLMESGRMTELGEIADISYGNSPMQIERVNQVKTATVSCAASGRDLQSVSMDVAAALAAYDMPSGYAWDMGGEAQDMMDAFVNLVFALLLAVLLVYMILATQFESLIQPFVIMLAIPFALTGAFIGLFVTNTPLSLVAFLGIIMLSGVVVNNSILLIDFINKNKTVYASREEAIVNAGRFRLRPILMTGLTTCLGLLPLSLGIGSGGELQAPMGITVIGGLIFSTVITLVIVPVIYTIVDDRSERSRAKREARRRRKLAKLARLEAAEA